MSGDYVGIFPRCGCGRPDRGGPETDEEVLEAAYVHQGKLSREVFAATDAGVEESLLDDGFLAGFRRLVYGDVFALSEQVSEYLRVFRASEEVLACHIFVVNEWGAHRVTCFW